MSGLDALGVAASAAQLAAYGKSIIVFIANIYERIQDAPQQYREYETQLRLLLHLAQSVERTTALQIPDVRYHLDATLVEVRALQLILCSPTSGFKKSLGTRSYWTLIKGAEQKQISVLLDRLHLKTTGLLLCINTVNTIQLSSIQDGVDRVGNLIEMNKIRLQSSEEMDMERGSNSQHANPTWRGLPTPPLENDFSRAVVLSTSLQQSSLGSIHESHLTHPGSVYQMPPRDYYGKSIVSGNAHITFGDETIGNLPNDFTSNQGSEFNLIHFMENFEGIAHSGVTGPPNGSRYTEIVVDARGEVPAQISAGQFKNMESKKMFFELSRRVQEEAKEMVRQRKMKEEEERRFEDMTREYLREKMKEIRTCKPTLD